MALRQRLTRSVISQFHNPKGLGGHVTGWIMGRRPSNVERNRWVVSLLDLSPADRILEVGFGPGVALGELARLALVVAYLASTAPRSWSGNSLASRP